MGKYSGDFVQSFICPHCEAKAPANTTDMRQNVESGWFFQVVKCVNPDCGKGTVFVYEFASKRALVSGAAIPLKMLHQYPTLEGTTHESIPPDVADSYKQGIRCRNANAPIGAVTCFRRSIQDVCKNKNTTKKDLKDQINEVLPDNVKEIAHEIRLWGNLGAHPDEIIKDVTNDDADELKDLLDSIFDAVYITPFKIEERRNKRKGT